MEIKIQKNGKRHGTNAKIKSQIVKMIVKNLAEQKDINRILLK